MIVFLTTPGYAKTHEALTAPGIGIDVQVMDYRQLLDAKTLPRATYVFTDLDRLPLYGLQLAAQSYRTMRQGGLTVLNDPARVLSRYGLLRRLHDTGFNGFNAYRVEDNRMPARWPAFLRCEGDHVGPITDLLHSAAALRQAIVEAVDRGLPISSLLIVEYAAEPTRPDLFRKLGCFRIGPSRFAHTCVHDIGWVAKVGRIGIAPPELYEDEHRIVREDPYGAVVAQAFDIAGIDYGRADFGHVGGRVQVYEINTNPDIEFDEDHPVPLRCESYRVFRANYLAALRLIDTPAHP
jgi:hypothetical protein